MTLGSAEIREQISAEIRMRSVFVSRAANVVFLSKVKEVVTAVADGELDQASARLALLETLRAVGYTPEGGFPDVPPGEVPPAIRGSIEDLSSFRRLNLIIETQRDLMRGMGEKAKGLDPLSLELFPAWELVRRLSADEPRDWPARWVIAGGKLYEGRVIALKTDPVWGELGSSGNFDDALDVDFPPFAFNSGMGWDPVFAAECKRLGVTGPDGESLEEWAAEEHAVLGGTVMPEPQISVRGADPEIRKKFEEETGAVIVGEVATTAAGAKSVEERLAVIAARRAERARRVAER